MRTILIMLAASAIAAPAVAAGPVKLAVKLTGAAEVPGPGAKEPGMASVTLDPAKGQLCYTLQAGKDATMAHIHKGAAGSAGAPVVPLKTPAGGMAKGCAPVAADLLGAMIADPAGYYVNVHSKAFPGGAVRGQLK